MNGQDCKNAFGKAPESFKNRVAFALSCVKEGQKVKRFSVRLILIAGIILILMAGAVYAASTEWKILDFVTGWYYKAPTTNLQKAMRENGVRQTFEAGDYVVTVNDAIADGRFLYISANVRKTNGAEVCFLPMNVSSNQRVCDLVGRHWYIIHSSLRYPLDGKVHKADELQTEDPPVSDDTRTLREAAKADGKLLVSASMWVKYGEGYNEITSFTLLPDGSVSFVLGSTVVTEGKTLDVELGFYAADANLTGTQYIEKDHHTFPLEVPVEPVIEKKVADAGGFSMKNGEVLVDRVEFFLTPLTLHYELYITAAPDYRSKGMIFRFFNEKDKFILPGLTILTSTKRLGDASFVQIGSLLLDKIPDTFSIRGKSFSTNEEYEKITLKVE